MGTSLLLSALLTQQPLIETRTLTENLGEGKSSYLLFERIVTSKAVTLINKTISPDGSVSFSRQDYSLEGVPLRSRQEGYWNDRWNIFETKYSDTGAVQSINDMVTKSQLRSKRFKNPTVLWFWKTRPKVGSSVTVDFLAQNTIATFKIKFTYEGDEKLNLKDRDVIVHRVRETPLSAPESVYTVWWYDDKGMGVRRYHKTTQSEYRFELLSWR